MCTSTAIVNSLECYMDDLIESFEDFIKKSLVLITVVLGIIVFALLYLLKLVSDRTQLLALQTSRPNLNAAPNAVDIVQNKEIPSLAENDTQTPYDADPQNGQNNKRIVITNQNNTTPRNRPQLPSRSNIDETLLSNISLNSSRITNRCRPADYFRNCSETNIKTSTGQSPLCIPKQHLAAPRCCAKNIASRNSCCSMCCDDDYRR